MFIIGTDKVSVSFGEKVILENVSFSVNQGEKVSIVGVNGAGKSTLMRLIYDKSVPFTGNVFIAKGKTLGHLEQQNSFDPQMTVYEAALSVFRELSQEEARLNEFSEKLKTDHSDAMIARFTALQQHFTENGGYEYKSRARGTLIAMGFDEEMLNLPISALSGGQKTILQLSLLLLEEPDILLLDEPTNHLDIESREALENALMRFEGTVIAVSHDRYFINKLASRILHFKGEGNVISYNGNYESFCEHLSRTETDVTEASKSFSPAAPNDWEARKKQKQEERKRLSRIQKIEEEMEAAETRICEIDQEILAISTDYVALQKLYEEKESLQNKCDLLLVEWDNLQEA